MCLHHLHPKSRKLIMSILWNRKILTRLRLIAIDMPHRGLFWMDSWTELRSSASSNPSDQRGKGSSLIPVTLENPISVRSLQITAD